VIEASGPRQVWLQTRGLPQATRAKLTVVPMAAEAAPSVLAHMRARSSEAWTPVPPELAHRKAATMEVRLTGGRAAISVDRLPGGARFGTIYTVCEATGAAVPPEVAILQVTDLGLAVLYDHDAVVVTTHALSDGAPLAGVALELRDPGNAVVWRGESDAHGLARAPGLRALGRVGPFLMVVRRAGDEAVAWLDGTGARGYLAAWTAGNAPPTSQLNIHVVTPRAVVQPGEAVPMFGVVRRYDARGNVEVLPEHNPILFSARSASGELLVKDLSVPVGPHGTFATTLTVPEDTSPGELLLTTTTTGAEPRAFSHAVVVERVSHARATVQVALDADEVQYGAPLGATISVARDDGRPLAGRAVRWTVRQAPWPLAPEGDGGHLFHSPLTGPLATDDATAQARALFARGDVVGSGAGVTDDRGQARVFLEVPGDSNGQRLDLTTRLTLEVDAEVDGGVLHQQGAALGRPAAAFVGLGAAAFGEVGQAVQVGVAVTDGSGEAQGRHRTEVTVRRERVVETFGPDNAGFTRRTLATRWEDAGGCTPGADGGCPWTPTVSGRHAITVSLDGVPALHRGFFAADRHGTSASDLAPSAAELVLDRPCYSAGQVAHALIRAPFRDGHGLLSVERAGLLETSPFVIAGSTASLEVPVEGEWAPNVRVVARVWRGRTEATGGLDGELLAQPAEATATINVPIDAPQPAVSIGLDGPALAGASRAVVVQTDLPGAAAAIFVTDDRWFAHPNASPDALLDAFHPRRAEGTVQFSGLARTLQPFASDGAADLVAPDTRPSLGDAAEPATRPTGTTLPPTPGELAPSPSFRFAATDLTTDAAGRVLLPITLPPDAATLRVFAIVVDGARMGASSKVVEVVEPLSVTPSRGATCDAGGGCTLGATVRNHSAEPLEVTVALRGPHLETGPPWRRTVPAHADALVEIQVQSPSHWMGPSPVQWVARAHHLVDVATVDLDLDARVRPDRAHRALRAEAAVAVPIEAEPGSTLTLSLSASPLVLLQAEVERILTARPGNLVALTDRLVVLATLRAHLPLLDLPGWSERASATEEARRTADQLMALLSPLGDFHTASGGPTASGEDGLLALWALTLADEHGLHIPASAINRARRRLLHELTLQAAPPSPLQLFCLRAAGSRLPADLVKAALAAPPDGAAPAALLAAALRLDDLGAATPAHAAATDHLLRPLLDGPTQADSDDLAVSAPLLLATLRADADPLTVALTDRATAALSTDQPHDRSALLFAIAALSELERTTGRRRAQFTAAAWLGDTPAARHRFEGAQTVRVTVDLDAPQDLIVVAHDGTLYGQATLAGRRHPAR